MQKIQFVVLKEIPGNEHDFKEVFRSESLDEARKKLAWKENLYGRIDKVRSTYTPPPTGKEWKEERFGWSDDFLEVIEEN
jgi:hypothetical protein